jgi:hypothetical protein
MVHIKPVLISVIFLMEGHITPKSDAVGRCSMNSDKVLSFDIKMTYGKNCAANGQLDFFVMLLYAD